MGGGKAETETKKAGFSQNSSWSTCIRIPGEYLLIMLSFRCHLYPLNGSF